MRLIPSTSNASVIGVGKRRSVKPAWSRPCSSRSFPLASPAPAAPHASSILSIDVRSSTSGFRQQGKFVVKSLHTLVRGGCESAIVGIRDQRHFGLRSTSSHVPSLGRVVHHHYRQAGAGVQASLDHVGRIVGHHNDAGAAHVRAKYSFQYRSKPVSFCSSRISPSLSSRMAGKREHDSPRLALNRRSPSSLPVR